MGVLLALGAAIAYGLSDFIGGVTSRRTSAWPVATMACTGSLLGSLVLALSTSGDAGRAALVWGGVAGIGSGLGSGFLYRGLGSGRMGVVAPVSGVFAAVLPVVVGVLSDERPSALAWLGIVVALPAIWLVAREPGTTVVDVGAVIDGVLAGLGFGMLFAATGQIPEGSGYWPLVMTQVVSVLAIAATAVLLGGDPVPRERVQLRGLLAGAIASLAVVGFLLATQQGMLTIASVLTSLYPAATVLLAVGVLRERVHSSQVVGLLLCLVTVVCVSAG